MQQTIAICLRQPTTDEEFSLYYDLRWRLLREPWGQLRGSERDAGDGESDHVMACDGSGRLVGIGRLHFNSPAEAQMRYIAVESDCQGRGVGRAILLRLEAMALARGAERSVLNSRDEVVGFYQRLGYRPIGPGPTIFGNITHTRMQKDLRDS